MIFYQQIILYQGRSQGGPGARAPPN